MVMHKRYVGRFAPTPSGPLHYGSLVAATASYLQAKHNNGQWLVRIEDIDPPREVPGSANHILKTLEYFQFEWDQTPLYQSTQHTRYRSHLNTLLQHGEAYACSCTRKDLLDDVLKSTLGKRYPGTCSNKKLATDNKNFNLRIRVENKIISFKDRTYGEQRHNLYKEIGDIVIHRKFDIPSYSLAVTVDDAAQGVTEVVRGYDLLAFTPIQIYLCQRLNLPVPKFMHVPIIVNKQQQKLSKQTGAKAVDTKHRCRILLNILKDLGQKLPKEIENDEAVDDKELSEIWCWAIKNWDADEIPKCENVYLSLN